MIQPEPIVILGAGHAGGSVAAFLRQYGHEGPIILIGEEPLAPYQRPPLSKAWLKGEADGDSLLLKPLSWYEENGVDLRLGVGAVRLDRDQKQVDLSNGETLSYGHLILATGARPRPLPVPGGDLPGLHVLRTAQDAERLKSSLKPGSHLGIIGGGYVGLEVAASARLLGLEVTVLEREPRLLARVASAPLAEAIHHRHVAEGVDIRTSVQVVAVEATAHGGFSLKLDDGSSLGCDQVLVGIGAMANDQLARDGGLDCVDGVVVDHEARTSDPAIFAIGDVTRRPLLDLDQKLRLESVPSALEQAKQAAAALTGYRAPLPEVPWFWSDQYDLKLQMAGLAQGADQVVVRGQPGHPGFAVFHLKGDRIQAVEAINAPAEFMGGRNLIARQTPIVIERLIDPQQSMKALAA